MYTRSDNIRSEKTGIRKSLNIRSLACQAEIEIFLIPCMNDVMVTEPAATQFIIVEKCSVKLRVGIYKMAYREATRKRGYTTLQIHDIHLIKYVAIASSGATSWTGNASSSSAITSPPHIEI